MCSYIRPDFESKGFRLKHPAGYHPNLAGHGSYPAGYHPYPAGPETFKSFPKLRAIPSFFKHMPYTLFGNPTLPIIKRGVQPLYRGLLEPLNSLFSPPNPNQDRNKNNKPRQKQKQQTRDRNQRSQGQRTFWRSSTFPRRTKGRYSLRAYTSSPTSICLAYCFINSKVTSYIRPYVISYPAGCRLYPAVLCHAQPDVTWVAQYSKKGDNKHPAVCMHYIRPDMRYVRPYFLISGRIYVGHTYY